jgi:hypothetical protein
LWIAHTVDDIHELAEGYHPLAARRSWHGDVQVEFGSLANILAFDLAGDQPISLCAPCCEEVLEGGVGHSRFMLHILSEDHIHGRRSWSPRFGAV